MFESAYLLRRVGKPWVSVKQHFATVRTGDDATDIFSADCDRGYRLNAPGSDPSAVVNKPAIQIDKGPLPAPVSLISASSTAKIPFDPVLPDQRCSRQQTRMDQEGK